MATTLTVQTGALTATTTTSNDAAAREALLRFAHATGAQTNWTNQQKLDHVAAVLRAYIVSVARDRYVGEESAAIVSAAQTAIDW